MAEAEIMAVLEALTAAWNDEDAAAYADQFTEDADYITFFGMNTPGRANIERLRHELSAGPLKGVKLDRGSTPPKIRFVRPDVAIVVSGGGGSSLDGKPVAGTERESVRSTVMVRDDGRWRLALFQNTRVSDPRGRS